MREIPIIRARTGRWRALYRRVRGWFRAWARLSAERDLPLTGRDINADLDDVAREMGRHEVLRHMNADDDRFTRAELDELDADFQAGGVTADAVARGLAKDLAKGNP